MDFLDGLNPRQREAVEHTEGPLLVLAGAGSGKTRVITHRIAHLISAHKVPGWAILAVTFTNKAAGEMRERVRSLVAGEPRDAPTVSTFHSFCVRLLRREGAALAQIRPGFTPQFTIYDDDDQISILRARLQAARPGRQVHAASRGAFAHQPRQEPQAVARGDGARRHRSHHHAPGRDLRALRGRLLESNALDFDDLLLEAVRLLAHDAPTQERINRRYEFLMVDEYQDTNRSQYELMRLLTGERHNIAVVGDEDQSIYGWRGANIRNILDFERDFPGAVTIRLEQNYRSTKNILEAASAVVANNTERIGKWLWTEAGEGDKITLYEAPDAENEALWIADTIEAHMARNPERARRGAVSHQRPIAPDRRSPAALRTQVHRGRRLQFLPARRSQGRHRVSEGPAQPAGHHQPAAHHQYAGARHRPDHHRADRAICADARARVVDRAGADAGGTRVPRPGGSGACGVPSHDEGTGGRDRNAAAGGNS